MCLLLKATDAKPKQLFQAIKASVNSYRRVSSAAGAKGSIFSQINAYKALFTPNTFKTNCSLSRIAMPLLLLYFGQPKSWVWDMETCPVPHGPSLHRDNLQQALQREVAPSSISSFQVKKRTKHPQFGHLACGQLEPSWTACKFRVCSPQDSGSITSQQSHSVSSSA